MAQESHALREINQLQHEFQPDVHRCRPQPQLRLPVGHRYSLYGSWVAYAAYCYVKLITTNLVQSTLYSKK